LTTEPVGDTEPLEEGSSERSASHWGVQRNAVVLFVAAEVVAFPLLLVWGRRGWFTQDDWDFLSARTAGNVADLFRAHFQHWTTLPVLVYRLMWVLFGMRSYTPYQALVIALHLIAAALVLWVMRRANVRPWLATLVAMVFLFFGSGAENILVAFQITFTGALVFGLTQLLLADHDGPIGRRDWLGLLAGFAGLACSGVAVTMTIIVGLAVLFRRGRRGWRAALFHTGPLAVAYALWSKFAPKGQSAQNYRSYSPTQIGKFVLVGIEATFARLGQVPGIGVALGMVLIVGLVVTLGTRGRRAPLGALGPPIALLAGGVVFLIVTGIARAGQSVLLAQLAGTGPDRARDSRYVYLVAAMVLPALAVAADALIRRWRQLAIPIFVLFLIGVPANIHTLATCAPVKGTGRCSPSSLPPFANAALTREQILAVAHLPFANQLRNSKIPVPISRLVPEGLTFGWLLDGAASGKIPGPGPLSPFQIATFVRASFLAPVAQTSPTRCSPAPKIAIRVLKKGQTLTFESGRVVVRYAPLGSTPSFPATINATNQPSTVVALVGPLRLRIVALSARVMVCG